jgi:hypothetical protein
MTRSRKKIKTAAAAKQHKTELSDMGLFELSVHALMPENVFKELKRRIELIRKHLNICLETTNVKVFKSSQATALEIVNSLLENPRKTRR